MHPELLVFSLNYINKCHPEGFLYFCHPQKKALTDTDMQVEAFFTDVNACTDDSPALARSNGVNLTDDMELTVQLCIDLKTGE